MTIRQTRQVCEFGEPHQPHTYGGLRRYCDGWWGRDGLAHLPECANRYWTDRVMQMPFRCVCGS